jgi:putative hemolysin
MAERTPKLFIANHPLGFTEIIASLKLMESLGVPYKMIANYVLAPPGQLADKLVFVDPTRQDRKQNIQAFRTILREFGSAYQHLFVFPAGICSRFLPSRGVVTDRTWSWTFLRIAIQKEAQLVPVWFSGRNSLRFYLYALALRDAAGLLIPREFFTKRPKPLVCRIGTPIPAHATAYFGAAPVAGLRAAVYTLSEAEPPPASHGRRALPRPRSVVAPTAIDVTVYSAGQVDRPALLALRRDCFGHDNWSHTDEIALHLIAHTTEGYPVGYYRALDWEATGSDLVQTSPIWGVYRPDRKIMRKHRVWEFGRFCIRPDYRCIRVARQLWRTLVRVLISRGGAPLSIGMVTLDRVNPVLAAAYFEFARRRSYCDRTQGFRPRQELVARSRHHDFSPTDIQFIPAPPEPLPGVLRNYLALGLRFGPSARWVEFENRPCVLVSGLVDEIRLRES